MVCCGLSFIVCKALGSFASFEVRSLEVSIVLLGGGIYCQILPYAKESLGFCKSVCVQHPRMAWVEKDHNAHPVPTPCYVQGCQPADQAAQSHIQPGLECLQGWGIHSLLG